MYEIINSYTLKCNKYQKTSRPPTLKTDKNHVF